MKAVQRPSTNYRSVRKVANAENHTATLRIAEVPAFGQVLTRLARFQVGKLLPLSLAAQAK